MKTIETKSLKTEVSNPSLLRMIHKEGEEPTGICRGCYKPIYGPSDVGYHPKSEKDPIGCRVFYLQMD